VSGATGLRLGRAIIACARNVKVLAAMRDFRCKMQVYAATQALVPCARAYDAAGGRIVWDVVLAPEGSMAIGHDRQLQRESPPSTPCGQSSRR